MTATRAKVPWERPHRSAWWGAGKKPPPHVDYHTFKDLPDLDAVTAGKKGPARMWAKVRASLVWNLMMRQKPWIAAMLLVLFIATAINLSVAQIQVGLFDDGIVLQTIPLGQYVPPLVGVSITNLVAALLLGLMFARISYQIEFDLRTWLYTRVLSASLYQLDSVASGQLITRSLTDLALLQAIIGILPILVAFVPIVLGLGIYAIVLNPIMGTLALMALPVNLYLLARIRHRLRGLSWAELNERAEVTTAIDEPVRGMRVVHAFGREDHERAKLGAAALRVYRFAMTRTRLLARYDLLLKSLPLLVNAFVLFLGARMVASDRLSIGTFSLIFGLVAIIIVIASALDQVASIWQYLRGGQDRLVEMLELGEPPVTTGEELPAPSEGLRFESVTFDIKGNRVVEELDLQVRPGELVVLTGGPGSGKSTVAQLAAGILQPSEGVISLEGVPLSALKITSLMEATRVVSEESFLFVGTVRDNLDLGAAHSVQADVDRALWAASAEDVVSAVPGGLEGQVGDRGLTLSGGQRQRLALARALMSPPRLLILDDALSAVQPALEVEILGRIRQLSPETAILCITRREGATAIADRVVALPECDGEQRMTPAAVTQTNALMAAAMAAFVESGLPNDPNLRKLVEKLAVSNEMPAIGDVEADTDDQPKILDTVLRRFKLLITATLLVLLVQTAAQLAPGVMLGEVSDFALNGETGKTDALAVAIVFIAVVGAVASFGFQILSQRFNQSILYTLRRRVFRRLSRLGIDYYDREQPGQVATRVVNDLDQVNNFIHPIGFRLAIQLAQFVLGMVVIGVIAPAVLLAVLLLSLVIIACTLVEARIANQAYDWARDALGAATAQFEEDFTGNRELRNLGATAKRASRFVWRSWELRRARRWVGVVTSGYSALVQTLGNVASLGILLLAGNRVLSGALSVGAAVTVQIVTRTATQPLSSMGTEFNQFINARVSWKRIGQLYDPPILPVRSPNAVECPPLEGRVAFENVDFSYPNTDKQVLHDISFEMEPGKVVALVGYTGAGKSSISKLLMRAYDPDRGRILVDGRDIRDFELHSYRRRLGVVPQDAFVFKGTIASNIAYGRPDATAEEVEAAARAVGAHEVLSAVPGGYNHMVEEAGSNLPAAQRQLIALARAWMVQPDILVLDESTSSLDAALEKKVLTAVCKLGCTVLTVTHRQSVVAIADKVVVLDGGRVVQMGPRRSVVGKGGAYDRLWALVPQDGEAATSRNGTRVRKRAPRRTPLVAKRESQA